MRHVILYSIKPGTMCETEKTVLRNCLVWLTLFLACFWILGIRESKTILKVIRESITNLKGIRESITMLKGIRESITMPKFTWRVGGFDVLVGTLRPKSLANWKLNSHFSKNYRGDTCLRVIKQISNHEAENEKKVPSKFQIKLAILSAGK